jgi:hypothetical protein
LSSVSKLWQDHEMTCIRNWALLVGAMALAGAGCGPAQLPGREGFGETGPFDTGTE